MTPTIVGRADLAAEIQRAHSQALKRFRQKRNRYGVERQQWQNSGKVGKPPTYPQFNPRGPSGWTFVGKGVSRHAYLGPDGVVYKVPGPQHKGCNVREDELCRQYRQENDSPHWTVPHTTLYDDDVLAMEYIVGEEPTYESDDEGWREVNSVSGDMHKRNAIKHPSGVYVIIDLGYG